MSAHIPRREKQGLSTMRARSCHRTHVGDRQNRRLAGKGDQDHKLWYREGVIVDTRRDRVWIYNRHQQPYFDSLAPIEFDSWPGFTLDCIAIRDARVQAGLT
jgi:hypothetical protein